MDIALALILHPTDETVLIAQRPNDVHLGGLWEFPGGKCRPGESPAACAVRETREEVGLEITILEAWPPIAYAYPDRTLTLYPYLCRAASADARPLGSRQVTWVLPTRLEDYEFPPANAPLLAHLQTRLATLYPSLEGGSGPQGRG